LRSDCATQEDARRNAATLSLVRLRASPLSHGLRGNCMGETLLLLSCGAAFITGLVIAAASLFG
jgi:hypothetical protein